MASLFCGCAGGWALVNPDLTQRNQGQVVEAVEMNDGRVIFFDPFDSAGPGPDTRARMVGETIQGTVDGVPRSISLQDVEKIQFGVSVEGKKAYPYLIGGVVFVALLVPLLYLIATGNWGGG